MRDGIFHAICCLAASRIGGGASEAMAAAAPLYNISASAALLVLVAMTPVSAALVPKSSSPPHGNITFVMRGKKAAIISRMTPAATSPVISAVGGADGPVTVVVTVSGELPVTMACVT